MHMSQHTPSTATPARHSAPRAVHAARPHAVHTHPAHTPPRQQLAGSWLRSPPVPLPSAAGPAASPRPQPPPLPVAFRSRAPRRAQRLRNWLRASGAAAANSKHRQVRRKAGPAERAGPAGRKFRRLAGWAAGDGSLEEPRTAEDGAEVGSAAGSGWGRQGGGAAPAGLRARAPVPTTPGPRQFPPAPSSGPAAIAHPPRAPPGRTIPAGRQTQVCLRQVDGPYRATATRLCVASSRTSSLLSALFAASLPSPPPPPLASAHMHSRKLSSTSALAPQEGRGRAFALCKVLGQARSNSTSSRPHFRLLTCLALAAVQPRTRDRTRCLRFLICATGMMQRGVLRI